MAEGFDIWQYIREDDRLRTRATHEETPQLIPTGAAITAGVSDDCNPGLGVIEHLWGEMDNGENHILHSIPYSRITVLDSGMAEFSDGWERVYQVAVEGNPRIQQPLMISEMLAVRLFGGANFQPPLAFDTGHQFHAYLGRQPLAFRVLWGGKRDDLPAELPVFERRQFVKQLHGTAPYAPVYLLEALERVVLAVNEPTLHRLSERPCAAAVVAGLGVYKLRLCEEGLEFYLTDFKGNALNAACAELLLQAMGVL